jgi:hypothetical protein
MKNFDEAVITRESELVLFLTNEEILLVQLNRKGSIKGVIISKENPIMNNTSKWETFESKVDITKRKEIIDWIIVDDCCGMNYEYYQKVLSKK